MRHLIQAVILAALLAAAPATPATARPAAVPATRAAARPAVRSVTDRELGLQKTSVFEVPSPPAYHAEESAPGDRPLPPRAGREAPPVVPHATADFLPITPAQNACADCHVVAGPKQKGEPTPVPPSHFVDQRHAPGQPGKALAGARWVCVSCHVGRTDAPSAVGSTFRP